MGGSSVFDQGQSVTVASTNAMGICSNVDGITQPSCNPEGTGCDSTCIGCTTIAGASGSLTLVSAPAGQSRARLLGTQGDITVHAIGCSTGGSSTISTATYSASTTMIQPNGMENVCVPLTLTYDGPSTAYFFCLTYSASYPPDCSGDGDCSTGTYVPVDESDLPYMFSTGVAQAVACGDNALTLVALSNPFTMAAACTAPFSRYGTTTQGCCAQVTTTGSCSPPWPSVGFRATVNDCVTTCLERHFAIAGYRPGAAADCVCASDLTLCTTSGDSYQLYNCDSCSS
eukprot:NODE_1159_length_975_cov_669.861771_g965_i0.p1 GENE.NODE_1159_length_975_cov_669.861771_g965_i0~~NODE_1159_length_975_cov_669.861771_g965_i0.p1  ORF type:complete len:286 (+),score=22.45 NODE_1159_length_975_cov_669.861771_g965_i0:31-888(+)